MSWGISSVSIATVAWVLDVLAVLSVLLFQSSLAPVVLSFYFDSWDHSSYLYN